MRIQRTFALKSLFRKRNPVQQFFGLNPLLGIPAPIPYHIQHESVCSLNPLIPFSGSSILFLQISQIVHHTKIGV